MPKWEKEIFLSCIPYYWVETFWKKNCFTLGIFGLLNVRVKEHTELKDEIRLELCMFKNNLHQIQEGLRRLRDSKTPEL